MATANVTHDLTISDASGSPKRGFMLAANTGRLRGHRVQDARTIQPRQLTMGELTEAESPPDIELLWSQTDWRIGLGGINHRTHLKQLANGIKVDASVEGKLQSARQVKATTADIAPAEYKATGFATVGTEVHAFIGSDVYNWDYTNLNWDQGTEPTASSTLIYRNGVEFDGETYVPSWTASTDVPAAYIHKTDADAIGTWTVGTVVNTVKDFKYLAKGRDADGAAILFGAYQGSNVHHLRTSTLPNTDTTTTWSTAVEIGEADSEITALVEDGDTLLVCKTNGVWGYFTDGSTRNLTPEFERMVHPDNFRGAFNWNGHVLLPLGAGGMLELSGGILFDVGLDNYAPEQTSLHGRVVAIHGEPTRLFIMVQDSLNYHVLMADWREFTEGASGQRRNDFRWHHITTIAATTGSTPNHSALLAEGITGPSDQIHHRLHIGVESTGSNLETYFVPLSTADVEDGFTNDTDQAATTTEFDANFPLIDKTFQSLDCEIFNLGAGGRTIEVEYSVDGGAFTALGTLDSTGSSQTLTFSNSTPVNGKIMVLKFLFKQTSVTSTSPQLGKFRLTCQLRPSRIELLNLSMYLADNLPLLNGSVSVSTKGDLSQLRTWAGTAQEVIVTDSEGTNRQMVTVPGTLDVREVSHEFGRRSEYNVGIQLAQVS